MTKARVTAGPGRIAVGSGEFEVQAACIAIPARIQVGQKGVSP